MKQSTKKLTALFLSMCMTVKLSDNLETIGEDAFSYCESLKKNHDSRQCCLDRRFCF